MTKKENSSGENLGELENMLTEGSAEELFRDLEAVRRDYNPTDHVINFKSVLGKYGYTGDYNEGISRIVKYFNERVKEENYETHLNTPPRGNASVQFASEEGKGQDLDKEEVEKGDMQEEVVEKKILGLDSVVPENYRKPVFGSLAGLALLAGVTYFFHEGDTSSERAKMKSDGEVERKVDVENLRSYQLLDALYKNTNFCMESPHFCYEGEIKVGSKENKQEQSNNNNVYELPFGTFDISETSKQKLSQVYDKIDTKYTIASSEYPNGICKYEDMGRFLNNFASEFSQNPGVVKKRRKDIEERVCE